MEIDVKGFYEYHDKYIKAGVIKEIYSDNEISLMNFADQYYAVFHRAKDERGLYFGCYMPKNALNYLVGNGLSGYFELLQTIDKDELDDWMVVCTDYIANELVERRTEYGVDYDEIDREFEQECFEKMQANKMNTQQGFVKGSHKDSRFSKFWNSIKRKNQ